MLGEFLRGIRVLDLSQYLPGPFCTRLLADMGCDVVKVEPPAGDPLKKLDIEGKPGSSPFYRMLNAGKTVICLDLKTAGGSEAFARLIQRADVLLESYRPGVLDRLGFGAVHLQALNPSLIHCALSGFGQTGPHRLISGHDVGYVAMTGALAATGTADTPVIAYPPTADHAGAMQAALTILGALFARQRSPKGQGGAFLDVSLMESLLSWQAGGLAVPQPRGAGVINGGAAFYQIYRTKDRRFVTLSPIEPRFWANFCEAVGRPDWIGRQAEPLPQEALIAELQALFASETLDHWEALLVPADCCYQAVLDPEEVIVHPHIRARGLVDRHADTVDVRFPAYVDEQPPPARRPLRQATVETVLAEWGAVIA
jgi:crotonobetainyl-CoA:carnitine CoA-transferase CaiB-like acyl-CoA transferase